MTEPSACGTSSRRCVCACVTGVSVTHPTAERVVSASEDGTVCVYDLVQNARVGVFHSNVCVCIVCAMCVRVSVCCVHVCVFEFVCLVHEKPTFHVSINVLHSVLHW